MTRFPSFSLDQIAAANPAPKARLSFNLDEIVSANPPAPPPSPADKMNESLYYSLEGARRSRKDIADSRSGVKGFVAGNADWVTERVPFIGTGRAMIDAGKALQSANKLHAGDYGREDLDTVANFYLDNEQAAKDWDEASIPGKAWSVVSRLPGIAAEFAMTAGGAQILKGGIKKLVVGAADDLATKAATKAVEGMTRKQLLKSGLKKVGDMAGTAALQTGINAPRLGAGTLQNMGPQFDEQGRLVEGDSLARGATRAFTDQFIENLTEKMGGDVFGKAVKSFARGVLGPQRAAALAKSAAKLTGIDKLAAVKNRVATYLSQKYGLAMPEAAKKLADKAAFNGALGEYLEERYGETMRHAMNALGLDLIGSKDSVVGNVAGGISSTVQGDREAAAKQFGEALEQTAVEGLAFSVPGAVTRSVNAANKFFFPGNAADWAAKPENADAAQKIAATVEQGQSPSRSMMEAAGLPKMDAGRRKVFGEQVKTAIQQTTVEGGVPAGSPSNLTPTPNATIGETTDFTPQPTGATTTQPTSERWSGDVTKDPRWLAAREAGTLKPPPKKKSLRTAGPTDVTMSPEELGPQPKRKLGPMTPRVDITQTQEMPNSEQPAEPQIISGRGGLELGKGPYFSTSRDQASKYATGEGPLSLDNRHKKGVVVEKWIKPGAKLFGKGDKENAELHAELMQNARFADAWNAEFGDAPRSAKNIWDTAAAAKINLQGILRARGYVGAWHDNYGGSRDIAIWDDSAYGKKGVGTQVFRGQIPEQSKEMPRGEAASVAPAGQAAVSAVEPAAVEVPPKKSLKKKTAADLELRAKAPEYVGDDTKTQDQFIEFVDDEFKPIYDAHIARELAKKHLRKKFGMNARRVHRAENTGKDYDNFKGYDVAAADAARDPDLAALGLEADNPSQIWDILKEGVLPPPSKTDSKFLGRTAEYFNALRSRRNESNSHPDIDILGDFDSQPGDDAGTQGSGGGRADQQGPESRGVQGGDSGLYETGGRTLRRSESSGDLAAGETGDSSFDFGDSGGFSLKREAAQRVVPEKFENSKGTQRRMLTSMDALAGQGDLFDADNVNAQDSPAITAQDATVNRPSPGTSSQLPPLYWPTNNMPTSPQSGVRGGVSRPQVITALEDAIQSFGGNVQTFVNHRRRGRNVGGTFYTKEEWINLRDAEDVATAAHEAGHAVEQMVKAYMNVTPPRAAVTAAVRKELIALGRTLYGNKKPNGGYASEGFAEFFRLWTQGQDAYLQQHLPGMVDYFQNTFLPQFASQQPRLMAARDLLSRYINQGADERVGAGNVDVHSAAHIAKKIMGELSLKKLGKHAQTLYAGVFEEFQPIREAEMAAERSLGRKLTPSESPYQKATALRSTASARLSTMISDAMIDPFGNAVGEPLADALSLVPRSGAKRFSDYLKALRIDALWNPTKYNPNSKADRRNGGEAIADAQAVIASVEKDYGSKIQTAAAKFHKWQNGVLDYISGLSDTLAGHVASIQANDPGNYVPLMRIFSAVEKMNHSATNGGSSYSGRVTNRLRGSTRSTHDVVQAAIWNAERLVEMAHDRAVIESLIDLQFDSTNPRAPGPRADGVGNLIHKVDRPTQLLLEKSLADMMATVKKEYAALQGQGMRMVDAQGNDVDIDNPAFQSQLVPMFGLMKDPKSGDPIISVGDGHGGYEWYYVDKKIYEALKGQSPGEMRLASKILSWPFTMTASTLRMGATGLNLAFGLIKNPARDIRTLLNNTQSKQNVGKVLGTAVEMYIKSLVRQIPLAGRVVNNPALNLAERLSVQMAQSLRQGTQKARRTARQLMKPDLKSLTNPLNFPGMAWNTWTDTFDWFLDALQFSDTAVRAAEIKLLAKDLGVDLSAPITADEAFTFLNAAKQVTTDFTATGRHTSGISSYIPFFRSKLQGVRAAARSFRRNPAQYLIRAGMFSVLPTALAFMAFKDEEWWKELPLRDKLANHFYPVGDGRAIMVPKNQDTDMFVGGAALMGLEQAYDEDPHKVNEFLSTWAAEIDPLTLPPLAKEIRDQYGNKDSFFERPIVTDEQKPTQQQADEYTSSTAKAIGELTDQSPQRVDHAIRGIFGGLGGDVTKFIDTLAGKEPLREEDSSDTPVVGTLFKRGGEFGGRPRSLDKFYDLRDTVATKQKDAINKETDTDRAKRLMLSDAEGALSAISDLKQAGFTTDNRRAATIESIRIAKLGIKQYAENNTNRTELGGLERAYAYFALHAAGDTAGARKMRDALEEIEDGNMEPRGANESIDEFVKRERRYYEKFRPAAAALRNIRKWRADPNSMPMRVVKTAAERRAASPPAK